jgi:hypothetical protein
MLLKDNLLLEQEGEYWIVYRISETYGKCPIIKDKDLDKVKKLI